MAFPFPCSPCRPMLSLCLSLSPLSLSLSLSVAPVPVVCSSSSSSSLCCLFVVLSFRLLLYNTSRSPPVTPFSFEPHFRDLYKQNNLLFFPMCVLPSYSTASELNCKRDCIAIDCDREGLLLISRARAELERSWLGLEPSIAISSSSEARLNSDSGLTFEEHSKIGTSSRLPAFQCSNLRLQRRFLRELLELLGRESPAATALLFLELLHLTKLFVQRF